MNTAAQDFSAICREWRMFRKLSQLDLALAANVSQRHVSWLETGRSAPSREMVIRLSDAMEIPLRERNVLLHAAGFAAAYAESELDEPLMAPVFAALQSMLTHHEPLPALVVDRFWNVKMRNAAADRLLELVGDQDAVLPDGATGDEINLALLTVHPRGLRNLITNWEEVAPAFVRRLRNEAVATRDPNLQAWIEELVQLAELVGNDSPTTGRLLPILPLELALGEIRLSLFSVISTIGTPQDVTTDELRVESFYPADAATEAFFGSSL